MTKISDTHLKIGPSSHANTKNDDPKHSPPPEKFIDAATYQSQSQNPRPEHHVLNSLKSIGAQVFCIGGELPSQMHTTIINMDLTRQTATCQDILGHEVVIPLTHLRYAEQDEDGVDFVHRFRLLDVLGDELKQ
jgi:hypothetical protein